MTMSNQSEVRRESAKILQFLRNRADGRGIVRASQKLLAEAIWRVADAVSSPGA